jgi:hypothetical protein
MHLRDAMLCVCVCVCVFKFKFLRWVSDKVMYYLGESKNYFYKTKDCLVTE